MNTNKKHKSKNKPNKPPNLNQTENSEIVMESEKESIVSENVHPNAIEETKVEDIPENQEKELEPKKPKRNKNKKKKTADEEVTVEALDVKPTEIHEIAKESDKNVDIEEKVDVIAPMARKKNKNKQGEVLMQPPTKSQKPETVPNVIIQEEQKGIQPITVDVKDDNNEQENKAPKKKNKKKKRHDSEKSEKADEVISCTAAFQMLLDVKADKTDNVKNVNLPTTEPQSQEKPMRIPSEPVQEIKIEEHVNKKKNKKGKNKEEYKPVECEIAITALQEKPVILKPEEIVAERAPEEITYTDIKGTEAIASPKSKAKIAKCIEEKVGETILDEMLGTEIKNKEAMASPKSKAKIAKPVERKQKHKPEEHSEEKQLSICVAEAVKDTSKEFEYDKPVSLGQILFEEKKSIQYTKQSKDSEVDTATAVSIPVDIAESVVKIQETKKGDKKSHSKQKKISQENIESTSISSDVKTTILPEDTSLNEETKKDDKKSHSKQKKISQENIESTSIPSDVKTTILPVDTSLNEETKKGDNKSHSKQKKISQENIEGTSIPSEAKTTILLEDTSLNEDDNFIIPSLLDLTEEEPKKFEETFILPSVATLENTETKIVEPIPETNVVQMLHGTEKGESPDELQVSSNKHKKRKKSPKPPSKTESVIALPYIPQQKHSDINEIIAEETKVKMENEPVSIPLQQITEEKTKQKQKETEIKLKPLDVTPDLIQYPRSTSSQISDSNNNTFIQEIITQEEINLSIPTALPDTPFIKGSGESPENPPDLKTSDITISEVKIISTPESPKEKTDLKSKVMEVNQDMEDLRMSIERSLAELTFLEKKDDETEKLYQQKCVTSAFEAEALKVLPPVPVELKPEETKGDIKSQAHSEVPILPPPRHDNKGKGKSKKKNKHDIQVATSQGTSTTQTEGTTSQTVNPPTESKDDKKDDKTEKKSSGSPNKSKQQSDTIETQNAANESNQTDDKSYSKLYSEINQDNGKGNTKGKDPTDSISGDFEPIESFEDAMTSSLDDVNKSFEMIARDSITTEDSTNNPQISVTAPEEETVKKDVKEKVNPVSQPKNLLGHPDIPVPSNRTDYKKEKNRPPNTRQAKVRIKDAVDIEPKSKQSKESQTETKNKYLKKDSTVEESVTCVTNENEEYVYKYSFRKVFLPNICHICKKELKSIKVPCNYCNLIFYCSNKHKDEGWSQHQALCFAVSTVAHHKNQKHIYADSKGLSGQAYRLFRMQLIVACEKVLKRKLVPWEQEAILYPRICANVNCREHRQDKLNDCEGCSQISYCTEEHLPKTHQKWCKSYALYQKLVYHQQTQGRLAPKLPTRVLTHESQLPDKINMVLATLYEERIDMNDLQYAALTQIATAPLTAAYSYQLYSKLMNMTKNDKNIFTIHIVNPELQYEADALNKWESLFLHLHPQINDLRIVLTGTDLNPGGLPLELLGKVKLCANCRLHARKLHFSFQDSHTYAEYWDSNEFLTPDIVCAFNPSIQRATIYNGKDQWPITINTIFKLKSPFLITSYTMNELNRDLNRIKECSKIDFKVVSKANFNPFASVRPDRNFITDDEIPLLFKNYCFAVLCGV